MPHGYCLLWSPGLLWTLVGADALIALAYFSIPVALLSFVRTQKNLRFSGLFLMFGLFILACGLTHLIEIVNIWQPLYVLSAGVKVFTAIISVITAVTLWALIPHAGDFIDSRTRLQEELQRSNERLQDALTVARRNEQQARESEQRFRVTLQGAPIGMAIVGLDGKFLSVNEALCDMLGYVESELIEKTFQDITHPDDLAADLGHVQALLDGEGESYRMEKRYFRADGRTITIQLDVSLVRDEQDAPSYFVSQMQEITQRKQIESALRSNQRRLKHLLENLPTAVVVHRIDGSIEYANPTAARMLKLRPQDLLDKPVKDPGWFFLRPDGSQLPTDDYPVSRVMETGQPLRDYMVGMRMTNGEPDRWFLVDAFPVKDSEGEADKIIIAFTDMTERKALQDDLARQAQTDPLTGLTNRRQFVKLAEKEIARARRHNHALSLLMIDIDHFKRINDQYGHAAGDKVICALADTCLRFVRENDVACRLGGEEYALLLPETDAEQAAAVAERFRIATSESKLPGEDGGVLNWTCSVGVASLSDEDRNIDALLNRADKALYRAKKGGRNQVCSAAA